MNLEHQVNKLLNYLGILYPHQIDIEAIAYACKAEVFSTSIRSHCRPHPTKLGWSGLYINDQLSFPDWRQTVAHELCHHVLHVASHLEISKLHIERHEIQASHFAEYLLVPLHMIKSEDIAHINYIDEGIRWIAEEFVVPLDLAKNRWNVFNLHVLCNQGGER
ncbi:ImmA/IrrE family metallo-endopeptidase [Paenibacillus cisolokensis]|uniref:ImmA/IrrE family metallo-endopeptidase n=1 Tax=Paenibacillus cisolokensis TaxID=1658519 RepID=UPI003D2B0390